jgi:hypothetical protein
MGAEWDILVGKSDRIDYVKVPWARPVSVFFTSIFCIEMFVKMLALGWTDYTASKANCFDGSVTILTLAVNIYAAVEPGDQQELVRYILATRLGRFGRLLGAVPQVALVVATFVRMIPAAQKLLQVLFVAMFVTSTVGTQLFGGLINYDTNPAHYPPANGESNYAKLMKVGFGTADYFPNNFNDLGSGMVVCFELLVVNNWFIIAKGFAQVSPMPLVRLFFVAFYVIGVLVCLNIVVAFALESFDAAQARQAAGHDMEDDGELAESMLLPAAESREHSDSIRMAQAKLVPVVPYHLPDAGVINHLIARSKQSNVRSGGGSLRVQVVPEQAGGAPGTATGGGSSHDAQGVEATAI